MGEQSLSLWHIESGLSQLLQLRDEMAESGDDCGAVDQQIAEYCAREVRKVDGIRSYLRMCDAMEQAAREESDRVIQQARVWAEKRDRLKRIVLRVMQDNGLKRLEGATGSLVVRPNPPAVEVQPELLPKEFIRTKVEESPDKKAIAAALKQDVAVPGARLIPSDRLEVR